MSKLRLAAVAATVACASMLVGGTGAAQAASLAKTVPFKATKGFKGTYTIDRFVSRNGKLYTVGTVKAKRAGSRTVTKRNVRMPATLTKAAQASQIPPIPGACSILNLSIQPINLNLLGLSVRTSRIDLRIEGVPGAGNLLGNLLCGITGILDPNALANTPLGQLAQILNALLALSPRTA
jgi:hypothetical protein